jgi:hypothetical protein
MLSAGQAWRTSRGLPVVGRLAQSTIARAHDDLSALPLSRRVEAESAKGAAIPFGWIDALDLPKSVDLRDADELPVLRLVDMRDAAAQS